MSTEQVFVDDGLTIHPTGDGNHSIRRGDVEVAVIVRNGDGWRACRMPGLRAFSPVGLNDFVMVEKYAVDILRKEETI